MNSFPPPSTFEQLRQAQPQYFSTGQVTISQGEAEAMAALVTAIESVIAQPAFQARVLQQAPAVAQAPQVARGVFYGYDFHLTADGPRLIEINTNAGGALLNAVLRGARVTPAEGAALAEEFVAMFREEWQLARGDRPLRRIAIVDEQPAGQFLAAEFELFRTLFAAHGIAAVVADPADLAWQDGELRHAGQAVDLVYNRLTDFALAQPAHAHLLAAYAADGVLMTPHPRAHALYADKRNLMLLADPAFLAEIGVSETDRAVLAKGVPACIAVRAEDAERLWSERKQWFFKPAAGFGSRAAYRGDKLTKRVFGEIIAGNYIAQAIAPPSEVEVPVGAASEAMKVDLRCYVYHGRIQLMAARVYQGQTTNFRTPGGGFAPVIVQQESSLSRIPESAC